MCLDIDFTLLQKVTRIDQTSEGKCKTKPLEENLCDFGIGNAFLDATVKA